ncbi:MAG: ABC transporter permease [Armatimonadota bacterium]
MGSAPWWLRDLAGNLVPVGLVLLGIWLFARARKEPLWADAFRRLRRSPSALAALAVIGLYVGVALLDSVGWRENRNADFRTVLQRIAERPQEYSYSAPLARTTTPETDRRPLSGTHLLGTDAVGNDVLFMTLRGARTALIIGGLTLLIMAPLALVFGLLAGYFGKRVDDGIQYGYTVIDSIPSILLLVSLIMVLGRGLLQLCLALGIAGWVGLCRIVRGETLRLREKEFVRAARAMGVSHTTILFKHILPNLMHLVVINLTLSFTVIVMTEAILAYLGLGVGTEIGSWGNMIDSARLELAREPVVWWNLAAASTALFILVLAFNLFTDALQDALNPRLRS